MILTPSLQLLLVGLAVFLGGCATGPSVYKVRRTQEWSAVVVGTGKLLTVIHPLRLGDRNLWIWLRGKSYEAYVTKVGGPHGEVELQGVKGTLPILPGDSGSPVYSGGSPCPKCKPVALVVGVRR